MQEAHVLEIMKPFVKSLSEIHKAGIIHRDIKPDNIMIQYPDGNVKLIDFGAAREIENTGESTLAVASHGYAPEEQYDPTRDRNGSWTDVYALCATMYHAIEGTPPPNAYDRLRNDEFKGFTVPVSANTKNVIVKGLSLLSKDRWQSMTELSSVLYPNLTETVTVQGTNTTVQPSKKLAKKRKPFKITELPKKAIIGIAGGLVAIVGIGIFALGNSSNEPNIPVNLNVEITAGNNDETQSAVTKLSDESKKAGTVVAVGNNNYGQCDVSDWSDIIAVSAGGARMGFGDEITAGLKSDGTVVIKGGYDGGKYESPDWSDIIAIEVGSATILYNNLHIVGNCLKPPLRKHRVLPHHGSGKFITVFA